MTMTQFERSRGIRSTIARRPLLLLALGGVTFTITGCGGRDDPAPTPLPTIPAPTIAPLPPPIASPVPGYLDPERWAGRTVIVASQGGSYQDAQNEAFFLPFALATGATIQTKSFDLGELRQQVEGESVTWDLADVPMDEVLPLAREGILAPIDYQRVDKTPLLEAIVGQYAVGSAFFSTVIAYAAAMTPAPKGWPDFWNAEAFVGERGLRRSPVGTLEFALLADGVPMDRIYPIDIDRAFSSLEKIRLHVAEWYDNFRQPVELVEAGNVTMASAYHVIAQEPDLLDTIAVQWNGGMLSADSWIVPRGAPNADVGMDLINFATRAIPCANFARLVPFGPVNRDAIGLIEQDRRVMLPTTEAHLAVQFVQGWNWWADNREQATARFEEWLLEEPSLSEESSPPAGS